MSHTWNPKIESKLLLNDNNGPECATDEYKEREENTFCDEIWKQCLEQNLPQMALETAFIKGIKDGNLKPDEYAQFMVQDAAYLKHGSDNWAFAAKLAKQQNEPEIEQYCIQRRDRWLKYAEGLSKKYHVKLDGIIIGQELKDYMEYESYITAKYEVQYAFVVVYACVKLWPFICKSINGSKAKENQINNVYDSWVDDNSNEKSAQRTEAWLNKFYKNGKIDKKISLEIVSNCLKLEINFFKQACNEDTDKVNLYSQQPLSTNNVESNRIYHNYYHQTLIPGINSTTLMRSKSG